MTKKRVLIIDHSNIYLRSYIVDPSLSANGIPIGGIQGTLKSIQKFAREIRPDKIIICWDGPGGSRKRKLINKGYKEGRTSPRLNWNIEMMSPEEKEENKLWQMIRLSEYYDTMPLVQLILENVEADDIISAVCNSKYLKDYQKVILSSDKDFIQLCNDSTVLYRPVQKEVLNTKKIIEQFGIHPINFALARAIAGDKSDNIDGVKGVGLPTLSKRFPFFGLKEECTIESLSEYCFQKTNVEKSKVKAYQDVLDSKNLIVENYKLMQLSSPSISYQGMQKIEKNIENENLSFNKTEWRVMMKRDGFGTWNWVTLEQIFNRIVANQKK